MSLVDLTNGYYLCDRCGTMVKQDEWHECNKGKSMKRSVEELEQLPIAVILDDELGMLVESCKDWNGLDAQVLKMVIDQRGLKDNYPELYI